MLHRSNPSDIRNLQHGSQYLHVSVHDRYNYPTNAFRTGATGYIAGDALYVLNKAHPEYNYSLLVRTQEKAEKIKQEYPNSRIVIGDLAASDILEREAAKADIVLRMFIYKIFTCRVEVGLNANIL